MTKKFKGKTIIVLMTIIFLGYALPSFAELVSEQWSVLFDNALDVNNREYFEGLAVNAEDVYVTGTSYNSSSNGNDIVTIKYDTAGNELWTARFDAGDSNDYARALAVDSDGVYVTGISAPIDAPADIVTIKYDTAGNELWTARFEVEGSSAGVVDLVVNADGIYVLGSYYMGVAGYYGIVTIKYDKAGNELWAARFNTSNQDYARALAVDSDGVYVAGTINTIGAPDDIVLIKYDKAGNELWTARFEEDSDDRVVALAVDFDGVYVTGTSYNFPNSTHDDIVLIKYDKAGNELWTTRFDEGASKDTARALAVDSDGVYVTGSSYNYSSNNNKVVTIKYDKAGNELWTTRFATSGNVISSALAVDASGVYVAGHFNDYTTGTSDIVTIKYDTAGNELWTARYDTGNHDYARALVVDRDGIYVAGAAEYYYNTGSYYKKIITVKFNNFVTVVDTTAPVVTAPANVSAEAAGAETAVEIGTATATDEVGVVSITSDAPASYPVGTTVVTWTATDAAGNTATATQNVTVADTTAPVVTAPANVSAEAAGEQTAVEIGTATATDEVGVVSITSDAPASYPVGTTVVTWTATDAAGNTATATQNVTVEDTTAPVVTAPAAVTAEAAGAETAVEIGSATAVDLVDGAVAVSSDAPASYPVGTTVVTWTATDAAGNTATATQNVTVEDTTAPVVTAPAAVTAEAAGAETAVEIGSATAVDLVDGAVAVSSDAPASYPVGTTVVTWTATDAAGNTATAMQNVTVADTTAPVVTAPANVSAEAAGEQTAVEIGSATAADLG